MINQKHQGISFFRLRMQAWNFHLNTIQWRIQKFPNRDPNPGVWGKKILFGNFFNQKQHENERNWTNAPIWSANAIITGRNEVVAMVIFLHLSVIHSVHRGGYLVWCQGGTWSRSPPRTRYTPQNQVHPQGPGTPPGLGTAPQTRYTSQYTPTPPPRTRYTPPPEIRPTSGRYASYWNAFLL